jgi:hypothetical protein
MKAGRLFIASPSFTGDFCSEFVCSLLETVKDCGRHGVPTLYRPLVGVHWIDIARDILAHVFLASDCTHMLQIDSDLGFPADAARRLMAHDKDIVGGAYRIRHDHELYPVHCGDGVGLIPADALQGGFLMVKREVIEKMSDGPKYAVAAPDYGSLQVAPLFTREMRADGYVGEDIMFCRRAKAAGFDAWCDTTIPFEHVGRKAWAGTFRGLQ